jgi:hypothetical protein
VLATWLRGRMHARDLAPLEHDDERPHTFAAAWRQIQALRSLLAVHDAETITAAQLRRFVDAATEDAGLDAPFSAQAGIRSVTSPGAVIRPVDTIVWWAFHRDAAPPVRALDLSRSERAALAAAGVPIPAAGERALWAAQRWRRPLAMATRQLVLVCPRAESPGERRHPHPLWDEIVAAMPEPSRQRELVTARPGLADSAQAIRTTADPLPLPRPVPAWDVAAGALVPRARESPSALGTLVGCSFQWVLRYAAKLRDNATIFRLGAGPRELGSLAHAIMARVLEAAPPDPHTAETLGGAFFDEMGPRHVADLFMPGRDDAREDTRLVIIASARALVAWLHAHALTPELIEGEVARTFGTIEVGGRVDLLVGTPRVVVDLKWGGRDKRRREIETGTAHQLAAYAYAAATEGRAVPEYAYFILREQLMVGRRGGPFDVDTAVDGPSPSQAWQWFARACEERFGELARGHLVAPGAEGGKPEDPTIDGDRLALPAECEWCSYDALCGRAFADDAIDEQEDDASR